MIPQWLAASHYYAGRRAHAERRRIAHDHLGSAGVSMSSAGAVAQMQEYDPWGKVRTGGITATDINFTGQRLDATGLLYYHARMYDPVLGRLVSADSIAAAKENPQTRNRYSYVLNNPLKYADPTGHCAKGFDQTLAGCEQYLNMHGWNINLADWIYDDLKVFVDSLYDLK
jgi:RHS repeat-associated protein